MESDGYGFGDRNDQHERNDGHGPKYLLFVWKPSGYELVERDGEPPAVGSAVDLGDRSEHVTKIGPSPLPGDRRPCAYLLG
jgi:hypothetical protein